MKRTELSIIAIAVAVTACEKLDFDQNKNTGNDDVIKTEVVGKSRTFTFTIKGAFDEEPKTRGVLNANGVDMTDLWMIDYMGGELQQTLHLTKEDENFDAPVITLAYGSHHVYIVCSRGTNPVVDNDARSITWAKPSDTFWKDYTIDVTATSTRNRSCTLVRVASKLVIVIDDEVPAELTRIAISPSVFYYGINYETGEGTALSDAERSVTVPSTYVGTSGQLMVTFFCLSTSESWNTDINISAWDVQDGLLGAVVIPDVPMTRNKSTKCTGTVLNTRYAFAFDIVDTWEGETVVKW